MSETRMLITKSWAAAKRNADRLGVVTATAPSFAGNLLESANGDAERALSMVPSDGGEFMSRVREHLGLVIEEERASPGPLLRTGTGGVEG